MPQDTVRNHDTVRDEIRSEKDTSGLDWRKFSELPKYHPIPFGTLNAIYNGYPIPKKWYSRLGLADAVYVYPVNGNQIPAGSQVLRASFCECGRPFISNHPLRRRCFICSPYRGKK